MIKTAIKVLCTFHNARTTLNETKGKEAKKVGYAKTIRCGTPCHRKLLRSSTSALEGISHVWRYCKVAPHTPQLPASPEKIQLQSGTLLWDSCRRHSRWGLDGLYIPTCSGTSHRMTFQSPSSAFYVKHRLKMYPQSKYTFLFCQKSYGVIN